MRLPTRLRQTSVMEKRSWGGGIERNRARANAWHSSNSNEYRGIFQRKTKRDRKNYKGRK